MEIAKALWQLSYAMLIFADYLLFMIFVAPFGFGFATFVSAWSSFRGQSWFNPDRKDTHWEKRKLKRDE